MALHMFLNTIAHRNVLFLLYFYIPDIHVQNFVISAIRSFPPWILPSIYPVRGKFFRPASLYVFHKFDLSLSYFMYNCLFFLHLSSELPTLDPCIFCVLLYNNNFDTSSQWENCPAFTVIMHSISALFYLFLTRFERNFPVFFFLEGNCRYSNSKSDVCITFSFFSSNSFIFVSPIRSSKLRHSSLADKNSVF